MGDGPFGGTGDQAQIDALEQKLRDEAGKRVVEISDDEPPDEGGDDGLTPRTRKRLDRYDGHLKTANIRADEAEEALKVERESNLLMQQRLANLEGRVSAGETPPSDTLQEQITEKYKEGADLYRESLREGLTEKEQEDLTKRMRKIDQERGKLVATQAIREAKAQEPSPEAGYLRAQYMDVMQDRGATHKAAAYLNDRLAEGKVQTPQLVAESFEHARKWRARESQGPGDDDKRKFAGTHQGSGGGGKGTTAVHLDANQEIMARAWGAEVCPELGEEAMLKRFAKEVLGKKKKK